MANALETIAPKVLARGMLAFRDQAFFSRLVQQGFSAEAARKGDTIDVILPDQATVEDVEPGTAPTTPSDISVKTFSLKMNNWKKVAFHLTDKELMQVDADQHFIPFQMNEAVSALATEINRSFLEKVIRAQNSVGIVDAALFSDETVGGYTDHNGVNPAIASRKLLNLAKAPRTGRYAVIGYEDESHAIGLSEFADMDKSSDASVKAEGLLGRKYGFDWFATDPLFRHQGAHNPTLQIKTATSIGDETITLKHVDEPIKAGTVLTDGQDRTIGISSQDGDQTGDTVVVPLMMPLVRNYNANLSIKSNILHDNGIAFQRNAFAFAMRPLAAATQDYGLGNRILSVTDPASGLSLRLEISRQYKQTVWEFDALWGVELARPEFAVRLITSI